MYIPIEFRSDDPALLHDLIERWSFATLVTIRDHVPVATHLPLILDRGAGEHGCLYGHVARGNQQWQDFAGGEALAIFQGEHGYITPSWYENHPSVPTWNYLVVHAYGVPQVLADEGGKLEVLRALVAKHESGFVAPWPMDLPEDYLRKMMAGIVAFEMPISRLEGKFKLSQNRPREDQLRVIAALGGSEDPAQQALAAAMRKVLGAD